MKSNYPELFEFKNYREFLLAYASYQKARYPHWSYGSWARKLGVGGTATITRVLRGDRDPGPLLVEKLIQHFAFSTKEAEYFRSLVHLSKVEHHTETLVNRPPDKPTPAGPEKDDKRIPTMKMNSAHDLKNTFLVRHGDVIQSRALLARIGQQLKKAVPNEQDEGVYEIELMVRRLSPLRHTKTQNDHSNWLAKTGSTLFE